MITSNHALNCRAKKHPCICTSAITHGYTVCKSSLYHPCICLNSPMHALHCKGKHHPCICRGGSHHAMYCKAKKHDCICIPGRFKKALNCNSNHCNLY